MLIGLRWRPLFGSSFSGEFKDFDLQSYTRTLFAKSFFILVGTILAGFVVYHFFITQIYHFAYLNIGIWENGVWSQTHVYRFYVGLLLALVIAALIDMAHSVGFRLDKRIRDEESAQMNRLETILKTDTLTGFYNRYHFNKAFPEKLKIAEKTNHALLFFTVDINHFKSYNDQFV